MLYALAISLGFWQPATTADLDFEAAVEMTVKSWEPKAKPPEPIGSLIRQLDASCYHCREIATKKLYRASLANPRWLYWGAAGKSAEVRVRCNKLIRSIRACATCGGTGCRRLPVYEGWYPVTSYEPCIRCKLPAWQGEHQECQGCFGLGSAWMWDWVEFLER